MGGCEGCKKRRGEPGLTVRVVQENPSLAAGLLYGFAVGLGSIGVVMVVTALKPPKEIPV